MTTSRRRFLQAAPCALTLMALSARKSLSQLAKPKTNALIEIFPEETIATISPEIYSHFIEHLGGVIYDGVWVGENSKVPNRNGIRSAFIDAMRAVQAPVLRWPGGCFAESYDWHDGIGAPGIAATLRILGSGRHESIRHSRIYGDVSRDWM